MILSGLLVGAVFRIGQLNNTSLSDAVNTQEATVILKYE
jgi:hypothetical protein